VHEKFLPLEKLRRKYPAGEGTGGRREGGEGMTIIRGLQFKIATAGAID